MVHTPLPSFSQGDLKIRLDEPDLILHGSASESAGCFLRGHVSMALHDAIKVKSVQLRFVGKMKVGWNDTTGPHQRFFSQSKVVIDHSWTFLAPQKKAHVLTAEEHMWPFELALPGDLPESLVVPDMGRVTYRLKAVAERPTFAMNLHATREVKITRTMQPSAMEFMQSVNIANTWADKMTYDISIPAKAVAEGERMPVSFKLSPIAPDLKVQYISITLKEYITCTAYDHSKTDCRVIKHVKNDKFPQEGTKWEQVEILQIPKAPQHIICDTQNDLMKIKHKLKFTVSLINGDGHISELRAAVPVIISAISQSNELNALPAYEDALRTLPYDPALVAALANHNSSDSSLENTTHTQHSLTDSRNATPRHSPILGPLSIFRRNEPSTPPTPHLHHSQHYEEPLDMEDPFYLDDLARVPSYRTATGPGANVFPIYSASLPTYYDTIYQGQTA